MNYELKPDRLTIISQPVDDTDKALISHNLEKKAQLMASEFNLNVKQVLFTKGRYQLTITVPLNPDKSPIELKRGDPYLFIQASPFRESNAYLRIQFNGMPTMLIRPAKVAFLLQTSVFKGVSFAHDLFANMLVTEFHVAFDTPEKLSNLWLDRKGLQVTTVVYSRAGELQTVYQGDLRSALRVVAYNKRAELQSRLSDELEDNEDYLTRIEWRFVFRSKAKQPLLADLVDTIDMYGEIRRLSIYNAPAIKNAGILSEEVISFADHLGLKTILQSTDKATRRKLRTAVKHFKRKHFSSLNSESLINDLHKCLKKLFFVPRKRKPH